MSESDPWKDELSERLRSPPPGGGEAEHLALEVLISYHEKDLSADQIPAVQEHLAACSECTALLLDFANFEDLEPPERQPEAHDLDFPALKEALRAEIAAQGVQSGGTTLRPLSPGPRTPTWAWASIAALLVAVACLSFQLAPRSSPGDLATEVFWLSPDEYRTSATPTLKVPAWTELYVLTFGSSEGAGRETVSAEIHRESGSLALRTAALNRASDGTFRWSLLRNRLKPGSYRVQLFSPEGEALDSYRFVLSLEPSPG